MSLNPHSPKRFFVTSTGTDIGKTFITAALARQAKMLGRSAAAYKPVMSGYDPDRPENSDAGLLLRAMGLPLTPENITHVSPWRFAAALAPSMAAQLEKRQIEFDALVNHAHHAMLGKEDIVLIEGVGGVMVPLTQDNMVIDWIEKLTAPVLLVTGSYLGTISHTLTAMAVLAQRKIPVQAMIVNESETSSVTLQATVDELSHWIKETPIIPVARRKVEDGWKDIPELHVLLD